MKNKTLYNKIRCKVHGIVMASIALLSACTDNLMNDVIHSNRTLDLQATIQQDNVTRANDNGFADGDQIGVFVVNYDNGAAPVLQLTGNHADNVRFTYDDKNYKWTGSYQLYWKDEQTPVDVYGYYPFISQLSSIAEQPFSVERNQRDIPKGETISGYEKSDFLWAKAENIVPTEAAIILKHNHIMAGIEVALVEGYGFDEGEWTEAEHSVLVQNVVMSGTVNLSDGSVTCTGSATNTGIIPQKYQGKYRAVVIPQTVKAGTALFSITIGGKTTEFARQEAMEYYRGKLHKFTIEVNKSLETGDYELHLLSDAIVNWENDPISHDGTAREYITVHVNEGEYIGDVIKSMGIEDPSLIKNLKLTGCIDRKENFDFIREHIPYLEAVNLKDLRTKRMTNYYWEGGWGDPDETYPVVGDDYLPGTRYDDGAFENMDYLQYVVWPDHLKGIGNQAFAECPLRGSLIFPEGLKCIGHRVFYGHKPNNLTGEIYIPSTVEYIGDEAFAESYLTGELVLPYKMKYLGDAFEAVLVLQGRFVFQRGLLRLMLLWLPI